MVAVLDAAEAAREWVASPSTPARGLQITVQGPSLVELIRLFHNGRCSATLQLSPSAKLRVHEGAVVHAVYEELTGEAAIAKLLQFEGGESHGGESHGEGPDAAPVSVRRPLASVLLDALCSLEEPTPPERAFDDGMIAASSGDAPTRLTQLDALCGTLRSGLEGASWCALVDLERRVLLGLDTETVLPPDAPDALLDVALELFSGATLGQLRSLVGETEADAVTTELQLLQGSQLYVGARLGQHSAVLLLLPATAAPRDPLARLRACLTPAVE